MALARIAHGSAAGVESDQHDAPDRGVAGAQHDRFGTGTFGKAPVALELRTGPALPLTRHEPHAVDIEALTLVQVGHADHDRGQGRTVGEPVDFHSARCSP